AALKWPAQFRFSHLRALAFAPDSKTVAAASRDRTIVLWDVARRKVRFTLKGHTGIVHTIAFARDGKALASGGGPYDKAGEVLLWEVATGKRKAQLDLTTRFGTIKGLAFSPDGKKLAIVGPNMKGGVQLWDVAKQKEVAAFKGH